MSGAPRFTCWTRPELCGDSTSPTCWKLHRTAEGAQRCEYARSRFVAHGRPHFVGEVQPGGKATAPGAPTLTLPAWMLPKRLRVPR